MQTYSEIEGLGLMNFGRIKFIRNTCLLKVLKLRTWLAFTARVLFLLDGTVVGVTWEGLSQKMPPSARVQRSSVLLAPVQMDLAH